MNRSLRWRPSFSARDLLAGLLSSVWALSACAPTVDLGCKSDDDCAPGRTCAAGQCTGSSVADASGGASGQPDAGGGASDAVVRRDATAADASVSEDARVAPRDAFVPAPDAGHCPLDPDAPVPMEQCNGLDDDCDGQIDLDLEGKPLAQVCYTGPEGTRGVGACLDGARACGSGAWGDCEAQVVPTPEVCDGLDNDCNGVVDDGAQGLPLTEACFDGPPETAGVGVCTFGARICRDGSLGPCTGASPPGQEICDGADNDCNGLIDDFEEPCGPCQPGATRDCYTGAPETLGVGDCQSGTQTCGDGDQGWGPCVGETRPESEACDAHDNDCNGALDDEIAGLGEDCTVGVGECAATGTQVCDEGAFRCDGFEFAPEAERCNGVDDDCDGLTDEDFALGRVCEVGVGACRTEGRTICADDGRETACDAVAGAVRPEDCDGLDNDCDGEVDEPEPGQVVLIQSCYEGPDGTRGVGPCSAGRQFCMSPTWGACVDQTLPWDEICDDVDNDCNGSVDDGLGDECRCVPGATQSCYSGPAGTVGDGVCHAGTQTCANGRFGACGGEVTPSAEICNGLDDDCNGRVDDVTGLGDACTAGVGACARPGRNVCSIVLGALTCDAVLGAGAMERCNGLDDDCDGVTDEDFDLGAPCSAGIGACQRSGVRICDRNGSGDARCDVPPGMPAVEVCDAVDNDCNMTVDDGVAASSCVAPFGTVAHCDVGQCRFSCAPRAFDTDANPDDGCEHGCAGPTTGALVTLLNDPTGLLRQRGDFAIVTDPGGAAGIAYQAPDAMQAPGLFLAANGGFMRLSQGASGGYEAPALTHIGGRWITFANHNSGGGLLASDSRFDGTIASPEAGAFELLGHQWARLGGSIPGAAAFWTGEQQTGVAYVVEPVVGTPYFGRLRTRVVNALTGMALEDGRIGDEADYVSNDARLLGFNLGNATAVAAQFLTDHGVGIRFLVVSPQGVVQASGITPDRVPTPSRDFAGALTNDGGTFALVDEDTGALRYWRLTYGPNGPVLFTPFDPHIDGVESVSVVYGQGGPMLFVLQNNALRVLFLDANHNVNGSLADVVLPPPGNSTMVRARVASNGIRINAAWTVSVDGNLQLRTAQLGCQ
jgi:hypothetical protein